MNRRMFPLMAGAIALLSAPILLSAPVGAADPARDAILADYAAQARAADKGFAGFSAQRGETLFRTVWNGGDSRTPACTSCHTADPRRTGQNAKTGRPIDPIAVSANPVRFKDKSEVEKHFARDCKSVLGRECTDLEKGDYVTFMAAP
jgi:hypothetical protein